MEKKFLYEALISVEIKDYPPDIPLKKVWIISSKVEEALNKLKEFLQNHKDIKECEILEIRKISKDYDFLIT